MKVLRNGNRPSSPKWKHGYPGEQRGGEVSLSLMCIAQNVLLLDPYRYTVLRECIHLDSMVYDWVMNSVQGLGKPANEDHASLPIVNGTEPSRRTCVSIQEAVLGSIWLQELSTRRVRTAGSMLQSGNASCQLLGIYQGGISVDILAPHFLRKYLIHPTATHISRSLRMGCQRRNQFKFLKSYSSANLGLRRCHNRSPTRSDLVGGFFFFWNLFMFTYPESFCCPPVCLISRPYGFRGAAPRLSQASGRRRGGLAGLPHVEDFV